MNSKIIKRLLVIFILTSISNIASAASVGTGGVSTAFSKNSTTLGIVVGSGTAFDDNYIILGASVGYYVLQGLEVGIDVQRWFSGDPSITKVSPQIKYVFTQPKAVKPYIGAFYRRTYFGDFKGFSIPDEDSFGYRAGAFFSTSNRVYLGGGIVYEKYKDCDAFASDCSTTYPEIIISVSF